MTVSTPHPNARAHRLRALPLSILMLCCPLLARADFVELANGDRISGRIVSMAGDVLVLRTDYAGELRLQRKMVRSLSSADTVAVLRVDTGELQDWVLVPLEDEDGRLGLQSEDGKQWAEVRLADIAYLNPTPDQSGLGVRYSGRALASAAAARGNTHTDRLYAEGELTARKKHSRYHFGGKMERREEQGNEVASAALVDANYDRFLEGQKRFRYIRGSAERDRFKDIRLRSSVGAGYGWQLAETETLSLSLRLGPDYVSVDRRVGEDESYPALGWGIQYSHWLWARRLQAFHEEVGFWNLRDRDAVSVRTKTGLRIPIIDRLTTSAQVNVDYEGQPTGGRKHTDLTWLLGLGYEW